MRILTLSFASAFTFAFAFAVYLTGVGNLASADYRSAVNALSPDNYWYLDETGGGAGTTAVDSAGSIDGTYAGFFEESEGEIGIAGPELETGADIAPGNLAFNANNFASVNLGPGAALANTTMTYAGWFKANASEGGDRLWTNNQSDGNVSFQIFFGGGFGNVAASIGIGLNPAINGFPAAGLPSGDTVGNFHIPDATVPTKDNKWHHIVASRNGNNIEDVIVVIDGVNYGPDTWADSTDTWGTTTTDAQIATRTPPDGGVAFQQALNGPTDEVAIWLGRQLTIEESIGLYAAAIGTPGDFDGDDDVDGSDFLVWQRNDGTPDGLAEWQGAFGAGALAAASSVPEPAGLTLVVLFGLSIAARRNR